jgi:hypothetical protein
LMALGAAALAEIAVVIAIGVLRSEKKVGGKGGGGIQKKTQKQGRTIAIQEVQRLVRACGALVSSLFGKGGIGGGCECLVRLL